MAPMRWHSLPLTGLAVAAAALAAGAGAQVKVSLLGDQAPRTALERHVLELPLPDKQAAAMAALFAIGAPAVPLLAAEVERAGASSLPALWVLERLGGEAGAAVPVLRRAAQAADGARRERLQAVLAQLDGPPCILVPCYANRELVQLDFDGKVVRRTACASPWRVWPLPDDHVGAVVFDVGNVVELDWQGKVVAEQKVQTALTSLRWFDDGDCVATSWSNDGTLTRFGPDFAPRWSKHTDVIQLERLFDGDLLAVSRNPARLRTFAVADGAERSSMLLPAECHSIRMLPDGNLLLATPLAKLLVLDRSGAVLRERRAPGGAIDAVLLRDGRLLVACTDGVHLLGAADEEMWHAELGRCGHLFVRQPPGAPARR
jgi:hypothetical protein